MGALRNKVLIMLGFVPQTLLCRDSGKPSFSQGETLREQHWLPNLRLTLQAGRLYGVLQNISNKSMQLAIAPRWAIS